MRQSCAVIFQAHAWSAVHALRYERMRREAGELADCHLLFQAPAHDPALRSAIAAHPGARFFATEALQQALGYSWFSDKGIVPGSAHFPLLEFSRSQAYDHYWLVESDVEFSGHWGELIQRMNAAGADLIASHVKTYAQAPNNPWWPRLAAPAQVPTVTAPDDWRTFAFLPVARFSARALRTIDQAHQQGWRGHAEVLIPSVLRQAGLEIADLNDYGPLYRHPDRNPQKTGERPHRMASLRWRPAISLNEFARQLAPDTLYHPIKAAWTYGPEGVTREHRGRLRRLSMEQLRSARWG